MDGEKVNIMELAELFLKYGKPRQGEELKTLRLLAKCGRTDYTPTAEECEQYDNPVAFMTGIIKEN